MSAASMKTFETFVRHKGVVEMRWLSDDPRYYKEPEDLFDLQHHGLSPSLGKKDKYTTEQVLFACLVCECELKSVVTLRDHVKGTQHQIGELRKMKESKMMEARGERL